MPRREPVTLQNLRPVFVDRLEFPAAPDMPGAAAVVDVAFHLSVRPRLQRDHSDHDVPPRVRKTPAGSLATNRPALT
jgi:hypothetical protein